MRNIVIYFFSIIIFTFVIPIIFTKTNQIEQVSNIEENNEEAQYEYSKYNTIKLLHNSTGEIEELNLDEYLLGVVSAEMPASYDIEALKAQAVVARTYTIYTIMHNGTKHERADICDNSNCCQAWISKEDRLNRWEESEKETNWAKIEEAVNDTKGKIVTYSGEPINAFFHSNSGGTTEVPINVWGGSGYPYLQVVATSGEENYSQYLSTVELTKEEVLNKLKEKHDEAADRRTGDFGGRAGIRGVPRKARLRPGAVLGVALRLRARRAGVRIRRRGPGGQDRYEKAAFGGGDPDRRAPRRGV